MTPDCLVHTEAEYELLEQLTEGRLSWDEWGANVHVINDILDDRWPLLPTGRQLAALSGTQTDIKLDIEQERRHLRACWQLQSTARSSSDLTQRGRWYEGVDGKKYSIKLHVPRLTSTMSGERQSWIGYIHQIQSLAQKAGMSRLDEATILTLMKSSPEAYPGDPPDL